MNISRATSQDGGMEKIMKYYAVITGASSGLGTEFARILAEKRPGEIKRSLLLLFFMFAFLTAVCWGMFHQPALAASSTLTATATVAPTIGLLPMPIRPIIST